MEVVGGITSIKGGVYVPAYAHSRVRCKSRNKFTMVVVVVMVMVVMIVIVVMVVEMMVVMILDDVDGNGAERVHSVVHLRHGVG